MKKRDMTTGPARVNYIELSFGETISSMVRVSREHLAARNIKLLNGRVYASSQHDEVSADMLYRMVAFILEAQAPKEIRYRYPLTWWDHFKEACFPAWALKRWPATYKEETSIIKDIYPFPNIDLGENLGPVYRIVHRNSFIDYPWVDEER